MQAEIFSRSFRNKHIAQAKFTFYLYIPSYMYMYFAFMLLCGSRIYTLTAIYTPRIVNGKTFSMHNKQFSSFIDKVSDFEIVFCKYRHRIKFMVF